MAVIEVVVRLTDIGDGSDIEVVQDNVMDALFAHGFRQVEPIGVTLVEEISSGCCNG